MHGITSPELFPVFSARGGDWKLTDTFDIVIRYMICSINAPGGYGGYGGYSGKYKFQYFIKLTLS